MTNAAGGKGIDLKWFGTLTPKQLMMLILTIVFALLLTFMGIGNSCICFGFLIIGVILYMLPRMFGMENIRLMTLVGVIFAVLAILIGGIVMAPGVVHNNEGTPADNNYFSDVQYTYTSDGVDINLTLSDNYNPSTDSVSFVYGEVQGITFTGINSTFNTDAPLTVSPTNDSASLSLTLDNSKLYAGYLAYYITDTDGNTVNHTDSNDWNILTGAFHGSITSLGLYGCALLVLDIMIVFFLIMIFSNLLRGRMERTRDKMEKEGRLYPQGYGKCEECGSVVLPGEVKCRKCGAYIDRPPEMKPDKKDFFECSDCGAEVPWDAKKCPKCGAEFDEDEEFEVTHPDGTVETTNESIVCPECGAVIPSTASFCTKCGAKFKK